MVFVLMIGNVEMLSGSKSNTQTLAYKVKAKVIGKASQVSPTNRSDTLISRHTCFSEVKPARPLECLQPLPDLGKDRVDKTRQLLSMAYFIQQLITHYVTL
jgi:hypothetical protein